MVLSTPQISHKLQRALDAFFLHVAQKMIAVLVARSRQAHRWGQTKAQKLGMRPCGPLLDPVVVQLLLHKSACTALSGLTIIYNVQSEILTNIHDGGTIVILAASVFRRNLARQQLLHQKGPYPETLSKC